MKSRNTRKRWSREASSNKVSRRTPRVEGFAEETLPQAAHPTGSAPSALLVAPKRTGTAPRLPLSRVQNSPGQSVARGQVAHRVASARLGELRSLVEAQKRTIVNMRTVRDEGALLIKEMEAAQRAFDSVNQRRNELSLESTSAPAGARVLTPAVAPLQPDRPKRHLVLTAATMLGLLLGVAAAIGLEMLDRRVRSADDLAVVEGVPVLAVLSSKPSTGFKRVGTGHERMLAPPPEQPPRLTMSEGT